MISLRWLADYEPEKLLYIERFKRNTLAPEHLFMTRIIYVKRCLNKVMNYELMNYLLP